MLETTLVATFERLEATPWVDRATPQDVASRPPVPA
jgi:hypothetical protein